MTLSVYVAGPWDLRQDAALIAGRFEDAGYTITRKWWLYEEGPNLDLPLLALEDARGVAEADLFVLYNPQPRGQESTGKAVETGIAMALMKPVILIGGKTNIFHELLDASAIVKNADGALEVAGRIRDLVMASTPVES